MVRAVIILQELDLSLILLILCVHILFHTMKAEYEDLSDLQYY